MIVVPDKADVKGLVIGIRPFLERATQIYANTQVELLCQVVLLFALWCCDEIQKVLEDERA